MSKNSDPAGLLHRFGIAVLPLKVSIGMTAPKPGAIVAREASPNDYPHEPIRTLADQEHYGRFFRGTGLFNDGAFAVKPQHKNWDSC